jgi:hypothetical protein
MGQTRALQVSLLVGLGLVAAACHHNGNSGNGDLAAVTDDLGTDDSGVGCLAGGDTCAADTECCSSMCDPSTHLCGAAACKAAGDSCAVAGDCCNLNCVGGTCSAQQCVSDGQPCTAGGSTCCSGPSACQGGTCMQLGNGCHTAGNACTVDMDCCSGKCDGGTKTCAAPSTISFCGQINDVCYKDADCCTSVCQIGGTGAGTCQPLPGAACLVDGLVCTGCNATNSTSVSKCCSTYCGQYSTAGSTICQPAGGCRIQGDLCKVDSDCCGGASATMCTLPGDGEVKCNIFDATRKIGTCGAPQGSTCTSGTCIPEGDVCHCQLVDKKGICWDSATACDGGGAGPCTSLPSGCSVSGVAANCCGKTGANKMTCRIDAVGVPRCYTISACVAAGGTCSTAATQAEMV